MLLFIRIEVATLPMKLGADQEVLRLRAEAIISRIDELRQIIQRISTQLRPKLLDNAWLSAAIEWEVKEFVERVGLVATEGDMIDRTSVDTD